MKKLFLILLLPLLGFSQKVGDIIDADIYWYSFNQSNLFFDLSQISKPNDSIIRSSDYTIVIHGNTTINLMEFVGITIGFTEFRDWDWDWDETFIESMLSFHSDREDVLLCEYYTSTDDCDCVEDLASKLFSDENILYDDITIGDMLKSKRLKEYGVVFYTTIETVGSSEIYQEELVVYYKAKFNPFIKSERKTRKITYMIYFEEVVNKVE